jgi:deoxyadenosine/deoxycytidine kinase
MASNGWPRGNPVTTEEKRESWPHRLVVVEGLIGVGKTSLARKLASAVGAGTVFEQPMENPFLERFYKDRRAAAFPAQLHFLFQRARQLSELRQHDMFAQVRVADYMLDKDRLFARIVLDDEEFKLYDQVYTRLALDAPVPDLVVFLQAPVDILLARIDKRGIPYEKYIDAAYLERLSEAYTRYFHQYTASPLLIVNTAEIDPANNSRDFDDLFETIRRTTSGRHYVNPVRA